MSSGLSGVGFPLIGITGPFTRSARPITARLTSAVRFLILVDSSRTRAPGTFAMSALSTGAERTAS